MKFLEENDILRAIREMTDGGHPMRIAVAYWGKEALRHTGLEQRAKENPDSLKVICDLRSGACNPKAIKELIEANVATKTLNDMHAKVWLCGSKLIVGSANVSANGLGFDNADLLRGNYEAAVYSDSEACAERVLAWFDELWKKGDEITCDQIIWAEEQWEARSKINGPRRIKRESLMQALKSKRNHKRLSEVHILVWRESGEEASEEAQRIFEDETQHYFSLQDWTNNRDFYNCHNTKWQFKKDRIFLDFRAPAGKEKTLTFKGIHRIISPDNKYLKVTGNENIVLFYQEPDCKNFVFSRSDRNELQQSLIDYLSNTKGGWESCPDGNILDCRLLEFVNQVVDSKPQVPKS